MYSLLTKTATYSWWMPAGRSGVDLFADGSSAAKKKMPLSLKMQALLTPRIHLLGMNLLSA
jgi:hypothetical protein